MATGLQMKEMDLIELYQLLSLYRRTYLEQEDVRAASLLEEIGKKYGWLTRGKDIREARNPREAGRKRVYSKEPDETILKIRKRGKSIRETAREAGCSTGHVEDVLRREREEWYRCIEINKNTLG